jgi:hypothetical protein
MFGLDPQSIAERVKTSGQPPRVPSLVDSVLRGMIGFTLVSLGGFAPWVLAGRWFYRNTGEAGLYVACTVVFFGLSGVLLHRLIIGPGSLIRFYQLFSLAFVAYAITWTIGWMMFRGVLGSVVGALGGMAVMGGILAWGFTVRSAVLKIIAVLFATNLAGYFVGEWVHNLVSTQATLSKAAWGLFYGLGFGAGIGWAFYVCQTEARRLIKATAVNPA